MLPWAINTPGLFLKCFQTQRGGKKTLISINSLAKWQLWKWSKYLSSNDCVVMETAARRCLLRHAVPRLRCCQAPVLCSAAPQQRLQSGSPQHPARTAPKQLVSEVNGESGTNSQRATAIYAKAILTYFVYKQQASKLAQNSRLLCMKRWKKFIVSTE